MNVHTLPLWEGHDPEYWRQRWQAGAVRFYERIGSTNDVAAELASGGAPHFSVVVAEEQFRGRGRAGSSWQAEPGSAILCSVMFRIGEQGSAPGCAAVRVGLAVAESISELAGVQALVKWPNDVVLAGHGKVSGVLCEGAFSGMRGGHIVAGIGINVSQTAAEFRPELHGQACSILSATGVVADRGELLTNVLARLQAYGGGITGPLDDNEMVRLADRDVLRDRDVTCEVPGGDVLIGTGNGIARDGALLVRQHDGVQAVYNGTVRLSLTHAYPGSADNS